MKTILIFVRHGESNANGNGMFAGHLDIELSDRGLLQAESTANYIKKNYHVNSIYSSDLQRAYYTAVPTAQACGLEINKTAQLREIFAGEWQGLSFDELQARYAVSYGVWLKDIGRAQPANGESVEALSDRIWKTVQDIYHKNQGKTVVIVTHATPIRALLCRLKGMTLDQMKDVSWVSNASVTVVRVEDDNWILEQTGEDAHLSGLRTQFPANV